MERREPDSFCWFQVGYKPAGVNECVNIPWLWTKHLSLHARVPVDKDSTENLVDQKTSNGPTQILGNSIGVRLLFPLFNQMTS